MPFSLQLLPQTNAIKFLSTSRWELEKSLQTKNIDFRVWTVCIISFISGANSSGNSDNCSRFNSVDLVKGLFHVFVIIIMVLSRVVTPTELSLKVFNGPRGFPSMEIKNSRYQKEKKMATPILSNSREYSKIQLFFNFDSKWNFQLYTFVPTAYCDKLVNFYTMTFIARSILTVVRFYRTTLFCLF